MSDLQELKKDYFEGEQNLTEGQRKRFNDILAEHLDKVALKANIGLLSSDAGSGGAHSGNSILVPCDFKTGDQIQVRVKDSRAGATAYNFSINALG